MEMPIFKRPKTCTPVCGILRPRSKPGVLQTDGGKHWLGKPACGTIPITETLELRSLCRVHHHWVCVLFSLPRDVNRDYHFDTQARQVENNPGFQEDVDAPTLAHE